MNLIQNQKSTIVNYGIVIILSFITMAIGGAIYLLYRTSIPVFFHTINFAGFEKLVLELRQTTLSGSLFFPNWIVYSLPNGLWAFAYAIIIITIWWRNTSKQKYFWLVTIPVLVFGFEFLQLLGLRYGTFCWLDLLSGLIGILLALLVGIKLSKSKYHENKFY